MSCVLSNAYCLLYGVGLPLLLVCVKCLFWFRMTVACYLLLYGGAACCCLLFAAHGSLCCVCCLVFGVRRSLFAVFCVRCVVRCLL